VDIKKEIEDEIDQKVLKRHQRRQA